jgi:hypothetical protein
MLYPKHRLLIFSVENLTHRKISHVGSVHVLHLLTVQDKRVKHKRIKQSGGR